MNKEQVLVEEKRELLCTFDGIANSLSHYGKQYGSSSKYLKWNCLITNDSTSGYISKGTQNIYIPVFISALFIIADYPSMDNCSLGWIAQFARVLSQYAKVVGSILGLGHIQESANGCINKWNSKSMFLCLSLLLSLKSIKWKTYEKRVVTN